METCCRWFSLLVMQTPISSPSHTWQVPLYVFADAPLPNLYLFALIAWAETESRYFGSFSSALQLFYLTSEPSSQGAVTAQLHDLTVTEALSRIR